MKTNLILAILTTFALGPLALADEDKKPAPKADHDHEHDHDHGNAPGPNGGKVLHEVEPHAELFVTKDRKLQFTFLGKDLKAAAPAGQTVSVICGKRSAPTRMKFEKKGNSLLSDKPLPAGKNIPTVIQIRMTPASKSQVIRLNLNLEECPTCDHLEYACTCDHHHDDDHKDEKGKKK